MSHPDTSPVVYLVDDDTEVLAALSRLLRAYGYAVRGFADPEAFLSSIAANELCCAVLDLAMPGMNGLAVQQSLRERGIACPTIFLTGNGDIHSSVTAMKGGAVDFLTKPVDVEVLCEAVGAALGRAATERAAAAEQRDLAQRFGSLTPREHEVLRHLLAGRLNKQVAADIGTVEKTVKVHRSRILQKLGVRSIAELTRLAEHAGIQPVAARR
ncbi:MAG: response regulator transcription factor [Rhodanobacteraceae bacterium]|nr:response regulator transcription factor [Rhodanobacteraceae bacterium]